MLTRGLLVAVLVAALDQVSKWAMITVVMQPVRTIALAPFLDIVLYSNRGISFGLFDIASPAGPWLLAGLAIVIVAGLIWWLREEECATVAVAIGLIIGGALGNVIDRLRLGAVTDFLYFHLGEYYWPAFNLADSAITAGVVVILIDSLFSRPRSRKKRGQ